MRIIVFLDGAKSREKEHSRTQSAMSTNSSTSKKCHLYEIFFTVVFALVPAFLYSQEYGNPFEATITVNSTSSLNGYTRNIVEVPLPENTTGYVLRFTASNKGQSEISKSLFSLLEQMPAKEISITASLAEFAINNGDGNSVDAFIFSNSSDANSFYAKDDENWRNCKHFLNMVSTCFYSNSCLNRSIFVGFRNNNMMQGIDVHIEVVPILDNNSQTTYTYSIFNSTQKKLKYNISLDRINWETVELEPNYVVNYPFQQPYLYLKIVTGDKYVEYKISPQERHKIIWSESKKVWDMIHY